jgi:NADH dehydrogenase
MLRKVLVLGGTGFVGRHVCEKLARLGVGLTVPTRRRRNAGSLATLPALDLIETDIHDSARLAALLPGHDAVVNLVAILQGDEAAFERTHVQLPEKLARACQQAGVRRVVHISALGADLRNPAGLPSMYLRSKSRGEQVLHQADLALTLIRPSVIFGAEDRFLNTFADLQRIAPFVPLAGAQARLQPVWVEDVASAFDLALAGSDATSRKTFELCGPEVMTLGELVTVIGECSGTPASVLPLPDVIGRAQAFVMDFLPGKPFSRDNFRSLTVDNVCRDDGFKALGIRPAALRGTMRAWRST